MMPHKKISININDPVPNMCSDTIKSYYKKEDRVNILSESLVNIVKMTIHVF